MHLYVLLDEINGDCVLCASWHNHVRILLRWEAKLLECWLHQGCVLKEFPRLPVLFFIVVWLSLYLVQDMFKVATSLLDIPQNSPGQS